MTGTDRASRAPERAQTHTAALLLIAVLLTATPGTAEQAGPVRTRLVSDVSQAVPGRAFWLGVELTIDAGWHVYWQNAGESGVPTQVTWQLPEGWHACAVLWPVPERFDDPPLVTYGYRDKVVLLSRIVPGPAGSDAPSRVTVAADVRWMACKEICRPGQGTASLELDVGSPRSKPRRQTAACTLTRGFLAGIPAAQCGWRATAEISEGKAALRVTAPDHVPAETTRTLHLFPLLQGLVGEQAPARKGDAPGILRFTVRGPALTAGTAGRLAGILAPPGRKAQKQWRAVRITVPLPDSR